MRKILTFAAAMLITGSLWAGGLVTNNNQSAYFTRLQNRNASTTVDAVYYNPAGLTKLGTGFFASINNQTINQTKTVTSTNPTIAGQPRDFVGKVSAPVFPGVYAAFNFGKFSLSAGFNPIGGGGGAKYDEGLPSFESMISVLPAGLSAQGIPTTQYDADIFFEGTSVYFGYQFNVAYKINDMISVAAGMRMVSAKNTYNGYMKNIMINPNYPAFGAGYTGSLVKAATFFTDAATKLNQLSAGATQYVTGLQPIISGGGGNVLLANGTGVGLSAAQVAQIQTILGAAGMTPAQIGAATIAGAQTALGAAAPGFATKAATMTGYSQATGDLTVDAEQTGTGYTPILSVNITPIEQLNIAVKYEFQTTLNLKTSVANNNGGGLFFDGIEVPADMPAVLSVGAEFKPIDRLMLAASFNTYMDQNVDYDGSKDLNIDMIDKNFVEYGLGAELGLTDNLRVSAGWLATSTGVNDLYQDDLSYSTNTNSFGAGFGYRITKMLDFNLGGQYTLYDEDTVGFSTFKKKTWLIGVGVDLYFGL
ncbi:MAG TPA: hypothetical protein VK207_02670 [Bacteroidales bacterium]|nr:hypothetical protein [Bacteroidales bacterium]